MKPSAIFFGALLLPISLLAQLGDYDNKIPLEGITDTWHGITLPNTVFGKVKHDLSDLRIYGITDTDTLEVPYVLRTSAAQRKMEAVTFKEINQSDDAAGHYRTYALPVAGPINEIQLDFEDENFDWSVDLEGSQDQRNWFTILKDYRVLAIKNEQTNYRFTTLRFPDAQYPYFRVRIKSEAPPRIRSTGLWRNKTLPAQYVSHETKAVKISQDGKATLIDVDLEGVRPISLLGLTVDSTYDFYRPIVISYVSDSVQTEKGMKYTYRNLARATLTSLEKAEFSLPTTLVDKLRIRIENRDNPPLDIGSVAVQGYAHTLLGRFTEQADYFLVYGNDRARAPQYDLQQARAALPETATALGLGAEMSIAKAKVRRPSPLFENKWWLYAIMSIVIVVLGAATIKMMGQKASE
ncbi:DUF3999 family protein [Maribacter sp. 2307ULW6-5]|uniref:DUF3999 family protein n=1 Tax=Maribacter sp. 2307ULW6-5 TaxID=3386275 RepID=UPI0039BD67EF